MRPDVMQAEPRAEVQDMLSPSTSTSIPSAKTSTIRSNPSNWQRFPNGMLASFSLRNTPSVPKRSLLRSFCAQALPNSFATTQPPSPVTLGHIAPDYAVLCSVIHRLRPEFASLRVLAASPIEQRFELRVWARVDRQRSRVCASTPHQNWFSSADSDRDSWGTSANIFW